MPVRLGSVRQVAQTEDVIGEVPLWDARANVLSWIDILKPAFHRLDPATGEVKTHTPPEKLGAYALTGTEALLIGGRGGMAMWTPQTGAFERLSRPEADRPENILNDGRADPAGRFLIASMNRNLSGTTGRLWQVEAGKGTRLLQDEEIMLPNALCWNPDGRILYFGDSHTNRIYAYDYDVATGEISGRRLFADTSRIPGVADGASVDAHGYLWNARFGGGCLIRLAPDGSLDQTVDMPVTQPSHVTFGGASLKTMYVTTARFRLEPEQLEAEPMAGALLAIEADVAGLAEPRYG